MGNVRLVEEEWPIVVFELVREQPMTDEDMDDFLAGLGACLRRGDHVCVIDMSAAHTVPSPLRHRLNHWLSANETDLVKRRLATIIVVPSAVQRGIVTAMTWMKRPLFLRTLSPNRSDALALARAALSRRSA